MSALISSPNVVFGDRTSVGSWDLATGFESPNSSLDSPQEVTATVFELEEFLRMNNLCTSLFQPAMMNSGQPFLQIVEEPVEKFRFRYKSEMSGTHGTIVARSHQKNRKNVHPSVKLCNYDGAAIVRCSLYTAQENEKLRTPHAHRLIVFAENNTDRDDPHEMIVSQEKNYTAIFRGMGIIHTARKNIVGELIKKKRARFLENLQTKNINITSLTTMQEAQVRQEAEVEGRKMNLNTVSLCFEAFHRDSNNCLHQICEPVFSKPINNMKSAVTGELRICRIDKVVSSCMGGEEVFILVEKVGKKNIRIKFSEFDVDGKEIWEAYGKFSELDVHHQYAIVFRTPPYRDLKIDKPVDVCVQLYRPSDGACSEPKQFKYKPCEIMGRARKRRRMCNESVSCGPEQNIQSSNRTCGNTDGNDPPVELMSISQTEQNVQFSSRTFGNMDGNDLPVELVSTSETDQSVQFSSRMFGDKDGNNLPVELMSVSGTDQSMQLMIRTVANTNENDLPDVLMITSETDQSIELSSRTFGNTDENDSPVQLMSTSDPLLGSELISGYESSEEIGLDSPGFQEFFNNIPQVDYWGTFQEDFTLDGEEIRNESTETLVSTSTSHIENKIKKNIVGDPVEKSANADDLPQKPTVQNSAVLQQNLLLDNCTVKVEDIFSITNEEGDNVFHVAVTRGHRDALKLMLEVRDIRRHLRVMNSQNLRSQTPLHLAVIHNQPEFVKMLLTKGADPNGVNEEGNTPIHLAIHCGHNECLTELLNKSNYMYNNQDPKCDEKNYSGQTPLHLSALKSNLFALKMLVENGAEVNTVDSTLGRHVLFVAIEEGNKEIVEYLLNETNVEVNLVNYAGFTALHYACAMGEEGNPEICKLLIYAKANTLKGNHEQCSRAAELSLSSLMNQANVVGKEEIESEDELHTDDDGEDYEENYEDNECDDDNEELSQEQTSIDLSTNKREILEICKRAEQASSMFYGVANDDVLGKEECSSSCDYSTSSDMLQISNQFGMVIQWCKTVVACMPHTALSFLYCGLQHIIKIPQNFLIQRFFGYDHI